MRWMMHPANRLIQKTQTCSYWLLPCVYFVTDAQKRKSKWDSALPVTLAQPTLITTTATLPAVVSVTTTASGTKTTVISAVGTILKKAKQWGWWTGCSVTDGLYCAAAVICVKSDGHIFRTSPQILSAPRGLTKTKNCLLSLGLYLQLWHHKAKLTAGTILLCKSDACRSF